MLISKKKVLFNLIRFSLSKSSYTCIFYDCKDVTLLIMNVNSYKFSKLIHI